MPRELAVAWLRAIAITFGGYPRPRSSATEPLDTLSDGFARALGYVDRREMEASIVTDETDWRQRLARADDALRQRYEVGTDVDQHEAAFRLMAGALNEWSAAKAARADWPSPASDGDLTRVLDLYGEDGSKGAA